MPEEAAWISPAHRMNAALRDAAAGQMPSFTSEELLSALGLTGEPDGLTLNDRFAGSGCDSSIPREVLALQGGVALLVDLANERQANDAQETLAHIILGGVIMTHLAQEGGVCTAVQSLVLLTTREDIVPAEVRRSLGADNEEKMQLARLRAERLKGFLEFMHPQE